MIIVNIKPNDKLGSIRISGQWETLMHEYKMITDYFLENHFNEFMAAMDKWNEEAGSND